MSVRYAPTNTLVKHIGEKTFERIKFIVIDDDLSASFTSKDLAGVNPQSDKFRRYRLPQSQDEECRGNPSANNTEQNVSYRDNLTEKNKLFNNLFNCYHPTQVSRISKFVCWSQGPLVPYRPKIALIFEVGGPTKKVQEFNWNDTPRASVFMCNNNGEIKKLAFGDARVSGVEFILLGRPAPISGCGDTASFLSLIPGNERAEEIFETIMDKTALEIQRARWGISSSMVFSSSESNSDDDSNSLRLKPRTSKKVTWDDEPSQPTNSSRTGKKGSMERKLVAQLGNLCHAPRGLETGQDNLTSSKPLHPETFHHSYHHPSSSAQFFGAGAANIPPRSPMSINNIAEKGFTATEPANIDNINQDLNIDLSFRKRRMDAFRRNTKSDIPKLGVIEAKQPGSVLQKTHLSSDQSVGDRFKEYQERALGNHRAPPIHHSFPPLSAPADTAQIDEQRPKSLDRDICTCGKRHTKSSENAAPQKLDSDTSGMAPEDPDITRDVPCTQLADRVTSGRPISINTEVKLSDCSKPHIGSDFDNCSICTSASRTCAVESPIGPMDTAFGTSLQISGNENTIISPHPSHFDRNGLPRTCEQSASPQDDIQPENIQPYEICRSDYPVFDGCIIQRGFFPLYPSKEAPAVEYRKRIGGVGNWYQWPPIQVSREYLPEGLKESDWSSTDSSKRGEKKPQ